MKSKNTKSTPVITIILSIAAVIMGLVAIFNVYNAYTYIATLVAQGMKISDQFIEVTNYYITTVSPYVFYGLTLAGLAYVTKKASLITVVETATIREDVEKMVAVEGNEEALVEKTVEGEE